MLSGFGTIPPCDRQMDRQMMTAYIVQAKHCAVKWVTWPWHAPFRGFVTRKLGPDIVYLCTKFDDSNFSCSRYITGAHQNLDASHDLTKPPSGMVCHLPHSTCYDKVAYQIWILRVHPLRRHTRSSAVADKPVRRAASRQRQNFKTATWP